MVLQTIKYLVAILMVLECLSVNYAQINEYFDSGNFPPTGWLEYHTGVDALSDSTTRAYSPTKSAFFDDDFGVDTSWLVTPLINVTNGTQLSFWQNQNYHTFYIYHGIWVSTTGQNPATNTFIQLDSLGEGTEDTWENKLIDLSQFAGQNIYIAFKYIGNFADEWYIDNVNIGTNVTQLCNQPTSLFSTSVTASSIGLSWSPVGGEQFWKIEYGPVGFTKGTGTTFTRVSANANITGLANNTNYDVYVTAFCSPTDSSNNSATITVKTNCAPNPGPIQSFTQNFDAETAPNIPCYWTVVNANGDNIQWETSTQNPNSGALSAYISYSATGTNQNDWLFSPAVSVTDTAQIYKLSFAYASRSGAAYPEKLEVISTLANDGTQLQTILFRDTAILTGNTYQTHTIFFKFPTTGTHYIGFHLFSNANQWDFMLDDISLENWGYTSVNELKKKDDIVLYPNPATHQITIQSNNKITSYQILNLNGTLVQQSQINRHNPIININHLAKGTYFIRIQQQQKTVTNRIIKQ